MEHFLLKKFFNTDSAKSDQTTSADPDPKDDTQDVITCQTCDCTFDYSRALAIHESQTHKSIFQLDGCQDVPTIKMKQDNKKEYTCKFCNKSSKECLLVAKHVRIMHCKGGNSYQMVKRFEQEHSYSEEKARKSEHAPFWEK